MTMRAATVPLFGAQFLSSGETVTRVTVIYQGVTATCAPTCAA